MGARVQHTDGSDYPGGDRVVVLFWCQGDWGGQPKLDARDEERPAVTLPTFGTA